MLCSNGEAPNPATGWLAKVKLSGYAGHPMCLALDVGAGTLFVCKSRCRSDEEKESRTKAIAESSRAESK